MNLSKPTKSKFSITKFTYRIIPTKILCVNLKKRQQKFVLLNLMIVYLKIPSKLLEICVDILNRLTENKSFDSKKNNSL